MDMSLYLTTAVIVAMALWAARYARIRHPATYLAVGVNLFNLLYEPLGREWLQGVLRAVIKG